MRVANLVIALLATAACNKASTSKNQTPTEQPTVTANQPPDATPAAPEPAKPTKPEAYVKAVALLAEPGTWCKGASALVALKDRDGVVAMLKAYESRSEGGKMCLLDAMESLGANAVAQTLVQSTAAEQRRQGAHLMELFADAKHVPALEKVANDPEARVRRQALVAIATQRQNSDWEAAMVRLLGSSHVDTRLQAAKSLATRKGQAVKDALRKRLEVETDDSVKKALSAALSK
jgi:hypothetical protein